jgi:hypothetical protein
MPFDKQSTTDENHIWLEMILKGSNTKKYKNELVQALNKN